MRRAVSIVLVAAAMLGAAAAAEETAPAPPKMARLEGTASLDRHRPVVGAAVLASVSGDRPLLWLTSTDDKGLFYFERLPEGTYRVELKREGYAPIVKEGVAVRFPYRAVVEVRLVPDAAAKASASRAEAQAGNRVRLSGAVAVRGAGPLGEARVRLVRTDETEDPRSTLTLPDGTFEIGDLPAGAWRIEVLGAGYLPARMNVDLAQEARLTAFVVQQPANYVAPAIDLLSQEEPIPPPAR
jgi:hypothetical protein